MELCCKGIMDREGEQRTLLDFQEGLFLPKSSLFSESSLAPVGFFLPFCLCSCRTVPFHKDDIQGVTVRSQSCHAGVFSPFTEMDVQSYHAGMFCPFAELPYQRHDRFKGIQRSHLGCFSRCCFRGIPPYLMVADHAVVFFTPEPRDVACGYFVSRSWKYWLRQ